MASKKTTSSQSTSSKSKRTGTASTKPHLSPQPPREEKPVISATTWITLLVLILVVGFAYLFNQQKAKQQTAATPTAGTAMLFTSAEGQPNDIKIESSTGQSSVEVARNASGTWVLKAPTQANADQASVEAAATQIGALSVVGNVQLGLDIVGLAKPAYTITVTFTGGKTHKLSVGSVNPIQTGYYSQLDGGQVQIIDKQGLDALLTMLTNPPYVATATPAETATPEITPTVQLPTETPTPNTSPTPAGTQSTPSVTPTP